MKISTTKKAAILATVLGGFVLGNGAEAANLGIVTASDYSTSHMGAIVGSYINSDDIKAVRSVITGLNRDPAVYNTVDQITGESSLYIRQYNYSTTNLQNSYAFDAQGTWKEEERAVGNTTGAVNAHDVVRHNDYVYVTSYDEGTVGIAKVEGGNILDIPSMTVNLKEDLKTYRGIEFADKNASLHGEGVVIVDGALYVMANVNPKGGYTPYDPSYLFKYVIQEDGSLSFDGCTTMGKNTDSVTLNVYNNYILANAIGGYQFYGAENSNKETSINVATIHPEYNYLQSSREIYLPENLYTVRNGEKIPKSEFRSLKVLPNGTAYVMTYYIGKAGKNLDVRVYQTTVSNLLSSKPQNWKEVFHEEAAPGWFGRLDAEYNTKRLWVQVGNKLHIYTDGATDPNVFGTDSFAASGMYEELYTWDIISTDIIPDSKLVKLNVVDITENTKAPKWNTDYTNIDQRLANVNGQVTIEGNANPLIHLDKNAEGNLTNNVLAGIYAEGVNTSVISNNGLQIQVQNNIASPVGIYAGAGGSIKYYGSNADLNIITKTMDGGNTLTNAVLLDPSVNGGESITINAKATNITMEGGYGGNGVAVKKTDRWGENSKASTQGGTITITGDLNIKGKDNGTWGIEANPTNVLSRFNNAGILVDVNNSSVTVGGNVDMDVYGNGVTVTGDNSTVTIEKGGTITVPKGTEYGYYALAAYDGTINMNANAGANAVKLNGDIFVTSEGTINLGLATKDSYLKGIVDNGGIANVTLKNGAVWTNEANNKRYIQDNEDIGTTDQRSHVTKLTGGKTFDDAGTIVQTANSKLLYIDNLDGAVKVNFTGQDVTDTNPETKLNNGVTIDKAVEGSQIALFTTNAGIKTDDEDSVNAVLNALANKLYYNAYKDGERNLTGVAVGMDEGLTASSVTKQANIQFIEATGQGSLSGSASDGTGINPDTGVEDDGSDDDEVDVPEVVIPSKVEKNGTGVADGGAVKFTNFVGHGVTVNGGYTMMYTGGRDEYVTIGVANGTDNNYYALNAKDGKIVAGVGQGSNNSYAQFPSYVSVNLHGDVYVGEKGEVHLGLYTYEDWGYESSFAGTVINNEGGIFDLQIGANSEWINAATNKSNEFATSYINTLGIGRISDELWHDGDVGTAIIRQTPESGDIVVEKLGSTYISSGWMWKGEQGAADAKIYYTLDAENPTDVKGGSVVIDSAVAGSKIVLSANYVDSIDATNLQNVFNSLANKLYYRGYIYNTDNDGNVLDANGNKLDNDGNIVDANGQIVGKAEDFVPAHRDGGNNLTAYVQIGEGLTASSIAQGILDGNQVKDSLSNVEVDDGQQSNSITFDTENGTLDAGIRFNGTTGQGSLTGKLEHGTGFYEENKDGVAFIDANGAYTRPIYGTFDKDTNYVGVDVLKNGVYEFTKAVNVFNTDNKKIDGGAWHQPVAVGISAHGEGNVTNVNMNNNDLVMTNKANGSGAAITAIDEGIINVNNPGNIIINQLGQGLNAGIFANSGGEVYINNAETGGVVTIRTEASGANGAGIKTMNGVDGVHSKVVITGMADIVADLTTGNNEALSAVASTIEVGGGNIAAVNGAWAAIRAYGEFVSNNTAIVNVNVVKEMDANGNIVKDADGYEVIEGAGNNKTTIYGDFVTNGGMGTLGFINVGLNGADSKWEGNYADCRGYGVTLGQDGQVNLFMKNGAKWEGFSDGEMNVTMEGEGTTWYGFNVSEHKYDGGPEEKTLTGSDGKLYTVPRETINGGLTLTLKDKATWINAFSSTQKDAAMSREASLVYNFIGDGGFIDMTGNKLSIASNSTSHQAGSNGVADQRQTSFTEIGKGETGNLVITNYSGDTTVIYRHDDKNVTNILGGTTTIKTATAGSSITLSTDSTGIDMTNTTQVTNVLDNLAEKLFYNAYATGERNLSGKVQIAEGLTTSSVGKYVGTIEFDANNNGQGGYKAGSLGKPVDPSEPPTSGEGEEEKPEDKPVVPEVKPEQKPVVEEEIKGAITGDSLTNKTDENPYKDLIGKDDNGNAVIDFGKLDKEDSKVDIIKIEAQETEDGKNSVIAAAPSKPVIIDVAGKDLAVNSSATSEAHGIQAIGGDVTIKDAGYITITANAGETGSASAIYAKGGENKANVTIENSDTVKLIAKGDANDAVLHADTNSNVNIKGNVEITDTNGKVAVEVAKGSTVALGGGVIGDEGTVAIAVKNGGSIVINKEGGQSVVINGKILLGDPQSKMMMMKAAPKAIEVPAGASSFNLTDDQSSMNDDVQYTGTGNNDFVAGISNGAKWTGNSVGGVDLDVYLSDSGAWTGYHENTGSNTLDMEISNGATWKNTSDKATTITTMSGEGGFVEMSENDNAGLEITNYSGDTTFIYAHNYGKDVKDEDLIKGGDVTITAVTGNSNIATMRTNNIGTSDKGEVDRVLKALAEKLAYTGYASNKDALTGKVQIMEGMTGSSVTREGQIKFDDTTGKGSLNTSVDVKVDYTGDYIYGDSETAMMKGAKSAMASTVMMWRSESNDLLQRMGDVRLATEESGVWAKYYGGKYEMDAQNTNFSTSYKAYQVGYDKAVGNGWNVGVAVSHNEGDSRYDRGGEGEMTVTSLSVYGNKDYGDGRYLGLILKGSQLKNEYEVFNNDGYKLEGDFKTWGTSISAEYGKRIEKGNGFYFDPSVELTIGHVQGKDYTATSDMLAAYGQTATMQVEQDDFNSIIGRVGFGIGQRTDKASYYAKLALAHEFGGDFDTHYTAEETKGTSISFGDTWYEMQLGGTAKLSDNSLLYATYERSFGGDVTEKWRVDAGLRVTF